MNTLSDSRAKTKNREIKPTTCAKTAKEKQYESSTARYTLQIFELFGQLGEPIGPSEIMLRLGINKNMSFRILRTMEEMGWIIREPGEARYVLGLRPFHFASCALDRMDIVEAAEIPMKQLWKEKGCLCLLTVLDGLRLICLRKFEQRGDFRYTVGLGTQHYLHNSAPGKAMLAWRMDELFDDLIAEGLIAQTSHTITDPKELKEHLADIRKLGYAVDRFECAEGLLCLAAPVFDYAGTCVGAINTAVLTANYTEERLLAELKDPIVKAATLASAALGYQSQ